MNLPTEKPYSLGRHKMFTCWKCSSSDPELIGFIIFIASLYEKYRIFILFYPLPSLLKMFRSCQVRYGQIFLCLRCCELVQNNATVVHVDRLRLVTRVN